MISIVVDQAVLSLMKYGYMSKAISCRILPISDLNWRGVSHTIRNRYITIDELQGIVRPEVGGVLHDHHPGASGWLGGGDGGP